MKNLTLKPKLLASLMMMSLPLSVIADDTLKAINAEGNSHIESAQLVSKTGIPKADRLVSYKHKGIALENNQGKTLSLLKGHFGSIDHRQLKQGLLLATVDLDRQQAMLTVLNSASEKWTATTYLPKPAFKIEGVCLYQDEAQNGFLFLVGEQGQGEQWLVADATSPIALPQLIRHLSTPPDSEYCQVDDAQSRLYINEEKVGIWAYDAHPEAELSRFPVAMAHPFGQLTKSAVGMAIVPGGLLVLDAKANVLHTYIDNKESWQHQSEFALHNVLEPEGISARVDGEQLEIAIKHDAGIAFYTLPWTYTSLTSPPPIPLVKPAIQTDAVPSLGDAADDPAIWVNKANPEQSLVLGTDKQGGLVVYDLKGKTQQFLPVGRLNNVDVRHGFHFNGKQIDLAVASNRDHNSLHVFAIDPASRLVTEMGEVSTTAQDIYGLCMYKNKQGDIYTIVNDKDGRFFQYQMQDKQGKIAGELVREFKVATQPEGCVADDKHDRLFIGEENRAVWTLDARADQSTVMTQVMPVGEHLKDDIEGISLYQNDKQDYLVISSQGNDSYVVLDALPPFTYRGVFRIGFNTAAGIDGVSETDGLDVSSVNFGQPWQQGMLVVQDGRNRMPLENQNFKYVPWSEIADQLGLSKLSK
ncbi:phytase [Methylophaga thalassica]|uniref:phytase n=1 Tax=Methylophaga aminisulfidivorans TaxID=230105 RepID=UPI0024E1DEDE|nr:phytase [Methylophaga aminisulfidivorans]